jgi:nitronate monooxygenase
MNFGSGSSAKSKAWRDIWGAGQGVGAVKEVGDVNTLVTRLIREYGQARQRLALGETNAEAMVEPA